MRVFILVTAIIEFLAGTCLFFTPQFIPDFWVSSATAVAYGRMYGAAAIAAGTLAIYVWINYGKTDLHRMFLVVFLVFHIGVTASIYLGLTSEGMSNPAPGYLHFVLATITAFYFFKSSK